MRAYHRWYTALLRLYPKVFRDRYGAELAQTFADLDRERRVKGQSEFVFVASVFAETSASVLRENLDRLRITARQLRIAALVSAALLTLPLVLTLANPASRLRGGAGGVGFDWMPGSFVVMGLMLLALILALQWSVQRLTSPAARLVAALGMLGVFGLVWVELAVGGVSQIFALAVFAHTATSGFVTLPVA
ncbi:MAG: hypothetical protein AAF249_16060 [Pseudomonadota bacterium]